MPSLMDWQPVVLNWCGNPFPARLYCHIRVNYTNFCSLFSWLVEMSIMRLASLMQSLMFYPGRNLKKKLSIQLAGRTTWLRSNTCWSQMIPCVMFTPTKQEFTICLMIHGIRFHGVQVPLDNFLKGGCQLNLMAFLLVSNLTYHQNLSLSVEQLQHHPSGVTGEKQLEEHSPHSSHKPQTTQTPKPLKAYKCGRYNQETLKCSFLMPSLMDWQPVVLNWCGNPFPARLYCHIRVNYTNFCSLFSWLVEMSIMRLASLMQSLMFYPGRNLKKKLSIQLAGRTTWLRSNTCWSQMIPCVMFTPTKQEFTICLMIHGIRFHGVQVPLDNFLKGGCQLNLMAFLLVSNLTYHQNLSLSVEQLQHHPSGVTGEKQLEEHSPHSSHKPQTTQTPKPLKAYKCGRYNQETLKCSFLMPSLMDWQPVGLNL